MVLLKWKTLKTFYVSSVSSFKDVVGLSQKFMPKIMFKEPSRIHSLLERIDLAYYLDNPFIFIGTINFSSNIQRGWIIKIISNTLTFGSQHINEICVQFQ